MRDPGKEAVFTGKENATLDFEPFCEPAPLVPHHTIGGELQPLIPFSLSLSSVAVNIPRGRNGRTKFRGSSYSRISPGQFYLEVLY